MRKKSNGIKLPDGQVYDIIPPIATSSTRGGIVAKEKTTETLEVAIDSTTGKAYVEDVSASIDITGKADKSYVDNAVSGLASENYVDEAVDGLASEVYVDNTIGDAVSDLVSESYVDNAVNNAVQDLASETYVDNAVTGLASVQELSNGLATKQNTLTQADKESIANIYGEIGESSENILDLSNVLKNTIIDANGNPSYNAAFYYNTIMNIKVEPQKTYVLQKKVADTFRVYIAFYKEDGTFISRPPQYQTSTNWFSFTTPALTDHIGICYQISNSAGTVFYNFDEFMLSQNSTRQDYKSFYKIKNGYIQEFDKSRFAFSAFQKFAVIGDSLSVGYNYDKDSPSTPADRNIPYSWGQAIARLCGTTCVNMGKSGIDTTQWLNDQDYGIGVLQAEGNKCQAYIIGLGVNDAITESFTIEDFKNNYQIIINAIKEVNERAKIFCFTMFFSTQYLEKSNAIKEVVTNNTNTYLIDIQNKYFDVYNKQFINDYRLGNHYTAAGYTNLGCTNLWLLSKIMDDNADDFWDIFKIPYDKPLTVDDLNELKVDKEQGKGLSTNDYTTAEKEKLASLENYDDTEIKQEIGYIENIVEHLPKISANGTDISLNNTVAGKMAVQINGNITQENTPTPSQPQSIKVVSGNNTVNISNSDNTESQSFQINLGNIKLCRLDTYKDTIFKNVPSSPYYNDTLTENGWYILRNIAKKVYTGANTEVWYKYSTNTYASTRLSTVRKSMCDYYVFSETKQTATALADGEYCFAAQQNNFALLIKNTSIEEAADFKTWLSNNNITIYYVLETPTTEAITDETLIAQLENLFSAMSYNDQTDLSSTYENGNAPIYLTAEVFVDIGTELAKKVDDVQINGTSITNDGVANVPIATDSTVGVVKTYPGLGTEMSGSRICISPASDTAIKAGTATHKPITPLNAAVAAFYGLAKAAGDTTQASSNNAVGNYTDTAKTKIQEMLGFVILTQAEYDAITIPNESTIYFIKED